MSADGAASTPGLHCVFLAEDRLVGSYGEAYLASGESNGDNTKFVALLEEFWLYHAGCCHLEYWGDCDSFISW